MTNINFLLTTSAIDYQRENVLMLNQILQLFSFTLNSPFMQRSLFDSTYFLLFGTVIVTIYYIDTRVLLENIPLVKFIKTTSGTRVVCFP